MNICDFCDEFSGGHRHAYALQYGQDVSRRTILSTESFRVVPSLGQIVEGHLLIAPVDHFRASADLSRNQTSELEDLCRHVRSVLSSTYGRCVFFEHGVRGSDDGGCGVDHAHMHAVPVTADGVLKALTQEFGGSSIQSLAEI